MKNINFLPESFNHQRTLRHARHWWLGVGVLFGLIISAAASGQWVLRRSLEAQLRSIEPQYLLAQQQQAEIKQLTANKRQSEELAALYSYLEYPWPKTQLLSAISQPQPESIQLLSLNILEQADALPAIRSGDGDTNHTTGGGDKTQEITPQSVLAELRGEHDRRRTILELSGEAENAKELHDYVDSLAKSPVFASASLKGLESTQGDSTKKVSKFEIRVVVQPGHGQPGSPTRNARPAEVAVTRMPGNREPGILGGVP